MNGAQVGRRGRSSGTLVNGAGALRFGGNNVWSEWFAGRLDEIRVYDRALTQAELQSDMTTPVACTGDTPPQPALSVSQTSLSFTGTQGGADPARADLRRDEHGRRQPQLHGERVGVVADRQSRERRRRRAP